jgi:pantoate--beta-alanine ligase
MMPDLRVMRTAAEVAAWREALEPERRVALVPTMGFLHEGHRSLIREARRLVAPEAGEVLVSIFVNPTQFGPSEDLDLYPRDEEGDLEQCRSLGVDVAFCPLDPATLYPSRQTWVDVEDLCDGLCGRSRPGHFRGVCTVVTKLLLLVRPDETVFGEKDFQQLAIIRRLHADLFLPGNIVGMPIVREDDGLAMSSRNANLSRSERAQAVAISRFLLEVRRRFDAGERATSALLAEAHERLAPGRVDYVEIVDAADLRAIAIIDRPALCAAAVRFGGVRLIDNVVLEP